MYFKTIYIHYNNKINVGKSYYFETFSWWNIMTKINVMKWIKRIFLKVVCLLLIANYISKSKATSSFRFNVAIEAMKVCVGWMYLSQEGPMTENIILTIQQNLCYKPTHYSVGVILKAFMMLFLKPASLKKIVYVSTNIFS